MNITRIARKLRPIEEEISAERGGFSLFALFVREEASYGRWDLVVSAAWLEVNKREGLAYFIDKLKSHLEQREFINLSVIGIIDNHDLRLEDVYEDVEVEHGLVELVHRYYFDMDIKHAYVITSKRENALSQEVA